MDQQVLHEIFGSLAKWPTLFNNVSNFFFTTYTSLAFHTFAEMQRNLIQFELISRCLFNVRNDRDTRFEFAVCKLTLSEKQQYVPEWESNSPNFQWMKLDRW